MPVQQRSVAVPEGLEHHRQLPAEDEEAQGSDPAEEEVAPADVAVHVQRHVAAVVAAAALLLVLRALAAPVLVPLLPAEPQAKQGEARWERGG